MSRLLREPLVWFLLIGTGLFALNAWRGDVPTQASPDVVVVTQGRIENLAAVFAKVRGRRPTPVEMRGLVRDFVLEEALVREGIKIGIDQDDTIIRRRIRQKMEFVVDDLLELTKPSESDLEEWLATHAADYAKLGSCTFRHVYFNAERRGTSLDAEVAKVQAQLAADPDRADSHELGDSFLLGYAFRDLGMDRIAGQFSKEFAAELPKLSLGKWVGPIRSSYGFHLVRVDARVEGTSPPLADVQGAVERDWQFAQRTEAKARFEAKLLERYPVTIEAPEKQAKPQKEESDR